MKLFWSRKINFRSIIYKAARLLDILIQYENNDLEYLEHVIRSYRRSSKQKGKLLKTEVAIFKTVKLTQPKITQEKKRSYGKK